MITEQQQTLIIQECAEQVLADSYFAVHHIAQALASLCRPGDFDQAGYICQRISLRVRFLHSDAFQLDELVSACAIATAVWATAPQNLQIVRSLRKYPHAAAIIRAASDSPRKNSTKQAIQKLATHLPAD
jgi:hypothetical protein